MPLDEETLSQLKLAQARFYQQVFASEGLLNLVRLDYQSKKRLLNDWEKRLRPLARRYKKNPIRFCERALVPLWFQPPKATQRQVRVMLKNAGRFDGVLAQLENGISDSDAKRFLDMLQSLAARAPGRKPLSEFGEALQLKHEEPALRIHDICLQLLPEYSQLKPAKQEAERARMRSGMARWSKARRA